MKRSIFCVVFAFTAGVLLWLGTAGLSALEFTALGEVFSTEPVSAEKRDWLIDPSGFRARVDFDEVKKEWRLSNGLIERRIVLEPAAATISLKNLTTGEEFLRAVGPEARVTINGVSYPIGGLSGQPVMNYFREEWIPSLTPIPNSFQFQSANVGEIEKRLEWKRHPEWLSRHDPWPPKGKHLTMTYQFSTSFAPAEALSATNRPIVLPTVEIHYEIYDGIPMIAKWLTVKYPATPNSMDHSKSETVAPVANVDVASCNDGTVPKVLPEYRIETFISEELRLVEPESAVGGVSSALHLNFHAESDYLGGDAMQRGLNGPGVRIEKDPDYPTQVSYLLETPCLFTAQPSLGPDQFVRPGEDFETYRVYELLFDGSNRERRGLALRRLYRTLAPWTAENPLMFHKTDSSPEVVRQAIEQCRETGFEMIIMSFGSDFNLESQDPEYRKRYADLAREAAESGVALGGYSLTSSRSAATPEDNVKNPHPCFGVGPCLGSAWGRDYLATLQSFLEEAGLTVLENDGPYPGDSCAAENHPGHHGLNDSVWVQWRAQSGLYRWCRAHGVFVNQPDSYFLQGGNKSGMGYRETNWSLPRAEQVIIERQNIFDGTWNKNASMGWMFVPLSQYHGGGEAATIEPLRDHLDHYDARFADLIGAGVQACYRGPRLYDSEETKRVVVKWVRFYKAHRRILDEDLIHLRRADGRDWDGWLHVDPTGDEKGLAFFYNPLSEDIVRDVTLPLYYTGLTRGATLRQGDENLKLGEPFRVELNEENATTVEIRIPAESYSWLLIQE